jgi:hypothetical protein
VSKVISEIYGISERFSKIGICIGNGRVQLAKLAGDLPKRPFAGGPLYSCVLRSLVSGTAFCGLGCVKSRSHVGNAEN